MAKLSRRKKKQIRRFGTSPKRAGRLYRLASGKGNRLTSRVFRATVAGKKGVIKYGRQDLARGNLSILQREHRKAVEEGRIKPSYYELVDSRYVYADENVGVMEEVKGIGLDTLLEAINVRGKPGFKLSEQDHEIKKAFEFLKKNPSITKDTLDTVEYELGKNLFEISAVKSLFSYDVRGIDNIIVLGVNPKTGRLRIGLVDQVYPREGDRVERILRHRRERKRE